jgi:C_GCAxxG_C_C family probable redox protein
MDPAAKAEQAYRGGCNCAQAVLLAFVDDSGLDRTTARRLASGFGGGMGSMGLTCGALTGGTLAIGLHCGDRTRVSGRVRELFEQFAATHGSTFCRELIGFDLTDPDQAARKHADSAYTDRCSGYVRDAAAIVADLIAEPTD